MDITSLSELELKALAYDEIAKKEAAQNNLNIINGELSKRAQPVAEETQEEATEQPEAAEPTPEQTSEG